MATFGAEYRGLVQYYLLAGDVWRLDRVQWVMLTALPKTLACKHRSTVSKMAARHKTTIQTPHGPRRCWEAKVERDGRNPLVARFGGIPLRTNKHASLSDRKPIPGTIRGKDLIARLLTGRCEACTQPGELDVHHVRKLADLTTPGQPQPPWAQLMAKRRRKTIVVCGTCHDRIHGRQPPTTPRHDHWRAG